MNPTYENLSRRRAAKKRFGARSLRRAAGNAIELPPPDPGAKYDLEHKIGETYQRVAASKPYFQAEFRAAIVLAFIGAFCAIFLPYFFGVTYLTFGFALIAIVIFVLAVHQAFFKPYPRTITSVDIAASQEQQVNSGEAEQKSHSLLAEVFMIGLCLLDGFLIASAISERAGQTIFTPRMAQFVAIVLAIALTALLWGAIKAAAREKRMQEARHSIRELDAVDPVKAEKMKLQIGAALGYSYGKSHDSFKARGFLALVVFFIVVVSFVLRLNAFVEAEVATKNENSSDVSFTIK